VNHKKANWIDKTAPVQHKKDNLDRQNSTSVVFLCCTGVVLSIHVVFLCCTGAVLSIQVVFFMLHWC
jgi:hypothetical protein